MLISPPFLQSGATIAITCPSGYLERSHTENARNTLIKWGFKVIIGPSVGHEWHYFSGADAFRLEELQSFLDDPNIAAIMAGRGGYGLSRIIDKVDFSGFKKYPKWLIGFSDITVLHAQVHKECQIPTIHGPMCHGFMEGDDHTAHLDTLNTMLIGNPVHYVIEGNDYNKDGETEGVLVGGNLAILAHLCGSASQLDTKGKILFIEEVAEHYYEIDRMMLTLKRAGMLDNLAGLICGGFTELEETERPFGMSVPELISEKVADYNYPVCFGFSAGHIKDNYPLMLGRRHALKVNMDMVQLISLPILP